MTKKITLPPNRVKSEKRKKKSNKQKKHKKGKFPATGYNISDIAPKEVVVLKALLREAPMEITVICILILLTRML